MKKWLGILGLASVLVLGNGVLAQGGDNVPVDTSPVSQIMRDLNVPLALGLVMSLAYALWRDNTLLRSQLLAVMQQQIDYYRMITPVVTPAGDFRSQSRELSRWGERPKTPPFGTDVPVSPSSPPS